VHSGLFTVAWLIISEVQFCTGPCGDIDRFPHFLCKNVLVIPGLSVIPVPK
jgi:hypothetical protein